MGWGRSWHLWEQERAGLQCRCPGAPSCSEGGVTWWWFKFPPVVWEGGVFPLCFKGVTMNQSAFKEREKGEKKKKI